jgi:uncharacterized protein
MHGHSGTVVEHVRAEVERACAAPENSFGYGIWTHHIVTVVDCGRALSERLGADAEIVELAALLHDYAGIRDPALAPEHHLHGAREAERLLRAWDYPAVRLAAVQHCILTHRASRGLPPQTLEARCLASADAVAHIAQVPSLLYLAYAHKGLDTDAGAAWVSAKLRRSYAKLLPEARELIGGRYAAALELLEAKPLPSG